MSFDKIYINNKLILSKSLTRDSYYLAVGDDGQIIYKLHKGQIEAIDQTIYMEHKENIDKLKQKINMSIP